MKPNYAEMTPQARYEALDAMARQFYGVSTWRHLFADDFGLAARTLTGWSADNKTPVWACLALHFALEARKLDTLREILKP
jgi:hypothetical protein